ncbi:MAG: phosphate acyltransferase [Pseudomonadota bacterium]
MSLLERVFDTARSRRARVVLPELDDVRVAEAAGRLDREGLAVPMNVTDISQAKIDAVVRTRGMKPAMAERLLRKPLYRAAAMVAAGEADLLVAGAANPTAEVIKAAAMSIGLAPGVSVPSSFFLMLFRDSDMVWADCAVNTYPDAEALSAIATASAVSAQALLGSARVALLSFSTGTSGAGASVDMVREVAERTGFAGPVQADAALNAAIAAKKGTGSGDANVLVFPSLDAGNIAYKLAQELAGAQAVGPFLQGFAKPVCDLSRGARVHDIVAATAVTSALMQDPVMLPASG